MPDAESQNTAVLKRRIHIFVCTNSRPKGSSLPCCADRGGRELLATFQSEFARKGYPSGLKISGSTCLTTCQQGPTVVIYPDGIWYVGVTPGDASQIIEAHLTDGAPIQRLLAPDSVRIW
jgi:(2Fe-2S) ferredoxin